MNVDIGLSIFLCTILCYSSIAKVISYKDFKKTISQLGYPLFLAWLVIGLEMVSALMLLFDPTRSIGEIIALLLFLSFYIVTGMAMRKKLKVVCNCFGKSTEEELGWSTMIKITPLFLASLISCILQSSVQLVTINPIQWISIAGMTVGILSMYSLWTNRGLIIEKD
ncbi:hypothetical protein MNQ98_22620 [Paenibacillus sp. N3/727]|uniref:MauE/DoxX family redox-associated membrane protein n=1 Tax=Paenibacillus sp. N3/727 TaxID=2925845 RepID=UPI001F532EF5|nr:MauE/DoxX family redox-associated membrane protein [Paenibacillus sp. N3/727]UNK17247.1 hypothetical protein MNQ98_22620 [Paenibacillus sp. N3/727]